MAVLVESRTDLYRAWLLRENPRPLVGLLWEPDIPPLPAFLDGLKGRTEVLPADVEPSLFMPAVETWHEQEQALVSDVIHSFCPAFGIPWTEAIAGCRVSAHPGSLWAEPCLSSLADRQPVRFDPENPWFKKLIEFTREMVRSAAGRFPVALPQMRGPLDMLSAMRSPERMCLDFSESPGAVKAVLSELTDLWIAAAKAALAEIPPFSGGYTSRMKMWAPGPVVTPQNDVSTLISPAMYRDFVLPCDARIMEAFPYHCFHLHATEHHHIENLLSLKKLTALQITLEHTLGGPPLDTMMPVLERVLEEKPLILVALDLKTAEQCIHTLPSEGLAVLVGLQDPVIEKTYEAWLMDFCAPA